MKATIVTIIGCISIMMSGMSFAWGEESSCASGDCGGSSCNPYVNSCQCTDPLCGSYDMNCLSTGACCEAFGNVGAR